MAIKTTTVTVGATATQLSSADADGRHVSSLAVYNPGPATIYVGGPAVTAAGAAAGAPVASGAYGPSFENMQPGELVYAITASGTQDVTVIEQGV